jgi:hypothetical protein
MGKLDNNTTNIENNIGKTTTQESLQKVQLPSSVRSYLLARDIAQPTEFDYAKEYIHIYSDEILETFKSIDKHYTGFGGYGESDNRITEENITAAMNDLRESMKKNSIPEHLQIKNSSGENITAEKVMNILKFLEKAVATYGTKGELHTTELDKSFEKLQPKFPFPFPP